MSHLDANALAGIFSETLGVDITAATGRCGSCGRTFTVARAQAFVTAMGAVMRCGVCDSVLAVIVTTDNDNVVSLSGLAHLAVPRS
jgi:hypothetical protein